MLPFIHRTFMGMPFFRQMLSIAMAIGFRAWRKWRTGSCVRRHMTPTEPDHPVRATKVEK